MKKLVLLAFVVAGLLACNSDFENDDVYSCNEQLDEWAHANLRNIQAMDWESWQNLDEEYKRPAYAAMTPSQKILFWKDKIQQVLQLDWTNEERQHITKLYIYLENNPNMYNPEILKDSIENELFRDFYSKWEVEALYDLRLTEEQVYGIIYTGNRLLNINGDYEMRKSMRLRSSGESGGSGGSDECNCNRNETGCSGTCARPKDQTCGFMGKEECNGKR